MPDSFGPFAKVWDELGSFDNQIFNLGKTSLRNLTDLKDNEGRQSNHVPSLKAISSTSTEDGDTNSWISEEEDFGTVEELPEVSCHGSTSMPTSLPLKSPGSVVRFSDLWHQMSKMESALQPAQYDEVAASMTSLTRAAMEGEQDTVKTCGVLTVVNMAGAVIGDFEVALGMTVSTLKDRIAKDRGMPPFTLTLLWGDVILEGECELCDIARHSEANRETLTLLHSAPVNRQGLFSAVWDALDNLDGVLDGLEHAEPKGESAL